MAESTSLTMETFMFYWERSGHREALRELAEHGIDYIVLNPPYTVEAIADDEGVAREALDLINLAYEEFGIRSVVRVWGGVPEGLFTGLFIDPEVVEAYARVVSRALERLRGARGLYAVYLDDEPYNRWDLTPEAVRDKYNDLFEEETGRRLPEAGRVRGRWDRETAIAYCEWVSEKYVKYLSRLVEACRAVSPGVATAVNFHTKALFPSADNPVDAHRLSELVDVVMVDIYPGWHLMPRAMEGVVGLHVRYLRCLTDKPLWAILQGHRIMLGYAPTIEQIERWAEEAVDAGCDAVGWFARDCRYAMGLRVSLGPQPMKSACPERWSKMLELCERLRSAEVRRGRGRVAILASVDSILSYGWLPLLYAYVTLRVDCGLTVDFVTDRDLERGRGGLEGYSCVYLGHTPILREGTIAQLESYVESGGVLVGCSGDLLLSERWRSLAEERAKLFGAVREESLWREWPLRLSKRVGSLAEGEALQCFWERKAVVEASGRAEVLATWPDGRPAALLRRLGGGAVVYVATRPYLANCMAGEGKWAQFMAGVAELAPSRRAPH